MTYELQSVFQTGLSENGVPLKSDEHHPQFQSWGYPKLDMDDENGATPIDGNPH